MFYTMYTHCEREMLLYIHKLTQHRHQILCSIKQNAETNSERDNKTRLTIRTYISSDNQCSCCDDAIVCSWVAKRFLCIPVVVLEVCQTFRVERIIVLKCPSSVIYLFVLYFHSVVFLQLF